MQPGDVEATAAVADQQELVMSVVEALKRDLGGMPDDVSTGTLAATARVLAEQLDGDGSATSKSMCAKELRDLMDRLYRLAPPARKDDSVDDLSKRRASRRAAS